MHPNEHSRRIADPNRTKEDAARTFEPWRRHLTGLAYRMLGSVAEAEDVVQDAYLRWHAVDRTAVADPRAYLSKIVTRLCLDHLKSARVRRETYVGPWLPEPVVDENAFAADTMSDYADDRSVAFLMTLERLSPLERAAFLLHDVFDMEFTEIGDALGRTPAACRQLAVRAREHVRAARPRFSTGSEEQTRLYDAFHRAMLSGNAGELVGVLAEDAVLYSDGGGKRAAALNPIYGRDKILRFLVGVARKKGLPTADQVRRAQINGLPGFIIESNDGEIETFALDIREERIVAIYSVRNPEKLRHLAGTGLHAPPAGARH